MSRKIPTVYEVQRRIRRYGLTIEQLNEFDRVCKTGKETIEWHAPTWVAMSRGQYEKLVKRRNRKSLTIYEDEYYG